MKKTLVHLAKFGLAFGLVFVLIRSGLVDLSELGSIGDRWPWLVAAQLPLALLLVIAACRWHVLMRARGVQIAFRDTYAIMLTGWFFNQTMPSNTGGDVAKAIAVGIDHPDRRSEAIMSILVDRLTGLGTLLVFALLGAWINLDLLRSQTELRSLVSLVAIVLLTLVITLTLFYSSWLRSKLPIAAVERSISERLGLDRSDGWWARQYRRVRELVLEAEQAVYGYREHPGAVFCAFLLSVGLHSMTVCVNLCLAYALLGPELDARVLWTVVPLAHIGMSLGITPGNIGVGEAIYAEVFRLGGVAQGGLICILQRAHWIVWALIGGVIFMLRRGRSHRPLPPESAEPAT